MIDRKSRNKLAETLRQYVSGRIINDKLDELNINNQDYDVRAIKTASWYLYDYLSIHKAIGKFYIPQKEKREISRWILFLQSDNEYQWKNITLKDVSLNILTFGKHFKKFKNEGDYSVCPFFKKEDFIMNPINQTSKKHFLITK